MADVNLTVTWSEELKDRADAAGLKGQYARLFRNAVIEEIERRETMSATLTEAAVHEIDLYDENDNVYTAKISGVLIARDERRDEYVYVTEQENVLVYDEGNLKYWIAENPVEDLRFLDTDEYMAAMRALGEKPVIELDI